mmetsp:Transcript_103914/g.298587  ORF Transcript_103914/g.298587 Transcript_103914/m.298587 type:complete len:382 (-) Transcript_103914:808-1953(-)
MRAWSPSPHEPQRSAIECRRPPAGTEAGRRRGHAAASEARPTAGRCWSWRWCPTPAPARQASGPVWATGPRRWATSASQPIARSPAPNCCRPARRSGRPLAPPAGRSASPGLRDLPMSPFAPSALLLVHPPRPQRTRGVSQPPMPEWLRQSAARRTRCEPRPVVSCPRRPSLRWPRGTRGPRTDAASPEAPPRTASLPKGWPTSASCSAGLNSACAAPGPPPHPAAAPRPTLPNWARRPRHCRGGPLAGRGARMCHRRCCRNLRYRAWAAQAATTPGQTPCARACPRRCRRERGGLCSPWSDSFFAGWGGPSPGRHTPLRMCPCSSRSRAVHRTRFSARCAASSRSSPPAHPPAPAAQNARSPREAPPARLASWRGLCPET